MENHATPRELTVIDIFRIIKKKAKTIALVTLIALILGAAGGAAWTFINNAIYGSQAEFYIYSEGANGYILSLLRSDSFAERLLLDKNGLPSDKKGTEAYAKALAAKTAVDAKLDEIEALEKKIALYPTELSDLKRVSDEASSKYTKLEKRLETFMNAQHEALVNKTATEQIYAALNEAEATADAAKKAYDAKLLESQMAEFTLFALQDEVSELNNAKKEAYDIALEDFRKNDDNLSAIKTIKKSVTFEYEKPAKDKETNDSQSHLYVNIAVKFDKELAQKLLDGISSKLPAFVEESVIAEAEERETECVYLSVFGSVDSVDRKNPLVQAGLFGAIAAVAAAAITAVVVVIVEMVKAPTASLPVVEAADEHPALEDAAEQTTEE